MKNTIRVMAATVLAAALSFTAITPAQADSLRLTLAKKLTREHVFGQSCDEIFPAIVLQGVELIKAVDGSVLTVSNANQLVDLALRYGVADSDIKDYTLNAAESADYDRYLRAVIVEKAVDCGMINDPTGQAQKNRLELQNTGTNLSSGSSAFEFSSGLSS